MDEDEDEAARIAEETYQDYKNKPDAEVTRKIGVLRSLVLKGQREGRDVSHDEGRTKGIDRVVHERERRKRRREGRDEVRSWVVPAVAAIGGLGGLIAAFWKSLVKWFGG